MQIDIAAFNTWSAWKASCKPSSPPLPEPEQDPDGLRLHHARWMLDQIIENAGNWKNDKLNRWLGYAQGLLVCYRVLTLEQIKRINKES